MSTAIDLAFADGVYTFDLGLAQINEIQAKCGAGIGAVYARVCKGRYLAAGLAIGNPMEAEYRIEDLIAVLKQGLIGGAKGIVDGQDVAVTAHRANELIENYVLASGKPLKDAWTLAAAVLMARIEGYDPPKDAPKPRSDESKKKAGRSGRAGSTIREPSPTAP
jgi:hypothetical protein